MSVNANFATTPRYELAVCSTANTAYDGTGTIVTLFTAGPNGSRVDSIGWAAQGSTTAGHLNIFARESDQDSWRYVFGWDVAAITASATVGPAGNGVTNINWILTSGAQIGISTAKAESFMVHVSLAGDF